uniref:Uncharacterized protein LOC100177807 n=1 Tax=Phallusia mammillata TaxID=59560 RepID=A0A6F9DHG4_9ASCI|nr:uncharacterized protein LOC100177807 [Phallusia mammillata]
MYHGVCVELGTSDILCLCIDNITLVETLCSDITSTTTTFTTTESTNVPSTTSTESGNVSNGLSPGAIAGVVIGCIVVVIAIVVFVFFLCKKDRKKPENPETSSYHSSNYVNPDYIHSQQINGDPIYMEIKPSNKTTFSSNDGEYIDISDAYYEHEKNTNNLTTAPVSNLPTTGGYEFADEIQKGGKPDAKKSFTKDKIEKGSVKPKPTVSRMDSAGYLTPTKQGEN